MWPVLALVFLDALAQTIYAERYFGELFVAKDGRIESLIKTNDQYWMTTYKQFIEIDANTGELMIAFNVGRSEYPSLTAMETDAHIMTTTLAAGASTWSLPTNVTKNAEGYIHGNMVLWYDVMYKQMVMVYQESRTTRSDGVGFDVELNLIRKNSREDTWTDSQELLTSIGNPHIRYQFVESATANSDGYPNELIIPIHHLAVSETDDNFNISDNYQLVVTINRSLRADAPYNVSKMEDSSGEGNGYFQASIVRIPSNDSEIGSLLVAFLRDSEGYWVYRSESEDDGISWTDPGMTAIANPDQTSQAIYLHSGLLMLIYNPSQSMTSEPGAADASANCHHLAIGLSADAGITWQWARMLEYAYDGMFNNPVGLQDPQCNNIYLTYSVMTDETNGCSMLDVCTVQSQRTMSYIKFTIITEQWVMNDFDYRYDHDNCLWRIPDSLMFFNTETFDILEDSSSQQLTVVIILVVAVVVVALLNTIWCYWSFFRKPGYSDLEMTQKRDQNHYLTTK